MDHYTPNYFQRRVRKEPQRFAENTGCGAAGGREDMWVKHDFTYFQMVGVYAFQFIARLLFMADVNPMRLFNFVELTS